MSFPAALLIYMQFLENRFIHCMAALIFHFFLRVLPSFLEKERETNKDYQTNYTSSIFFATKQFPWPLCQLRRRTLHSFHQDSQLNNVSDQDVSIPWDIWDGARWQLSNLTTIWKCCFFGPNAAKISDDVEGEKGRSPKFSTLLVHHAQAQCFVRGCSSAPSASDNWLTWMLLMKAWCLGCLRQMKTNFPNLLIICLSCYFQVRCYHRSFRMLCSLWLWRKPLAVLQCHIQASICSTEKEAVSPVDPPGQKDGLEQRIPASGEAK